MGHYENEEIAGCVVRLDGNSFRNCIFREVVFEFGGGEFTFIDNEVSFYVLSFVESFAASLGHLRAFAIDIGGGASEGMEQQIAAFMRPRH